MFKKDDHVRVKGDSSQVGISTGVVNKHGNRNLVQVNIIGIGLKNFPEEHLELINALLSPLEEIKKNRIVWDIQEIVNWELDRKANTINVKKSKRKSSISC